MQRYEILGPIGQGAYGQVLKCKCNDTKQIVAIKKFKETEDDEIVRKTTMREVKILKMLRHPNIVELKQAFRRKGIVYLVFQYVPHNLLEILQKSPEGIEPETICQIIYQLIKGLAYMHAQNIIHRDIKPQNLLVGERNQLKICDFGFARLLKKNNNQQFTDYVATRWYRPPELLVGTNYGLQIDMWAVGCILGQLIDGNPMFPGQNQLDQLFLIQKCIGQLTPDHYETFLKNPRFIGMKFPEIHNLETIQKKYFGKISAKGLNFLKQLLRMQPSERLTAIQALQHPYFDGIREDNIFKKLSINQEIRNESKISKQQYPHTVHNQRKKFSTNLYNPPLNNNQRQKTQEIHDLPMFTTKNPKLHIGKKSKDQSANRALASKVFNPNLNSKSVNKTKVTKLASKQKHISLQKQMGYQRQYATKTQTGFYLTGNGGIMQQRMSQNQYDEIAKYKRNKIYNIRSPKSKQNKRMNIACTQQVQQQDQQGTWQSTGQLPILMMASQKSSDPKRMSNQTNIIITNSTVNYKYH